jgi:hypothetical protein
MPPKKAKKQNSKQFQQNLDKLIKANNELQAKKAKKKAEEAAKKKKAVQEESDLEELQSSDHDEGLTVSISARKYICHEIHLKIFTKKVLIVKRAFVSAIFC